LAVERRRVSGRTRTGCRRSCNYASAVPDEFKADMVTVIRDRATGRPLTLVVIEPQGRKDREKRFSWPACLASLRAAHQCDSAVLIVICWDPAEAEKCREAIPMGHPGFVLVPIVIGPNAGQRAVLDAIRETCSSTDPHADRNYTSSSAAALEVLTCGSAGPGIKGQPPVDSCACDDN
jgi:hypothetical protein